MSNKIEIWAVYDQPSDYPKNFVARKFICEKPTTEVIITLTFKMPE